MTGSKAISIRGVTRRFGAAWVLIGISARFEAGTVTVVQGANGAGKSTLMAIVGGLLRPTGGDVVWDPSGVAVAERRGHIGWVGHDACCYLELTARENVALVASAHGEQGGAVEEALRRVGATEWAERRVGTLSRGQKQRVALARAVVQGPELLLLDEPFSGLDQRGCAALESVLREERSRGAIVVVVSHDAELAARLDALELWIERGRLRA